MKRESVNRHSMHTTFVKYPESDLHHHKSVAVAYSFTSFYYY